METSFYLRMSMEPSYSASPPAKPGFFWDNKHKRACPILPLAGIAQGPQCMLVSPLVPQLRWKKGVPALGFQAITELEEYDPALSRRLSAKPAGALRAISPKGISGGKSFRRRVRHG
jgi:hypothetical protein